MKKRIVSLLFVILLSLAMTAPAFAGGDQVRGDKAQGSATQVQVQDPPPFQP